MVDDDGIQTSERTPSLIAEHRIIVLIAITSLIGILFAALGLFLYHKGGSAQVDLSRPGYATPGVSETVREEDKQAFSATGPIDRQALDEFDALFSRQVEDAHEIDAFSGDPMAFGSHGSDE